jgi:hypothetical protein
MNVLSAIGFWIAVLSPFVFSLAAFLDITRTPSWVWALTGRQRVLWMSVIGGTSLLYIIGSLVACFYFATAGRELRRASRGNFRDFSGD